MEMWMSYWEYLFIFGFPYTTNCQKSQIIYQRHKGFPKKASLFTNLRDNIRLCTMDVFGFYHHISGLFHNIPQFL